MVNKLIEQEDLETLHQDCAFTKSLKLERNRIAIKNLNELKTHYIKNKLNHFNSVQIAAINEFCDYIANEWVK